VAELNTLVHDGFDADAFARALQRHEGLRDAAGALNRLLPHGDKLVQDLFCAVFKLNAVLVNPAELNAAVLINRKLVGAVIESESLDSLRRRTAFDEDQAAGAASLLARRVLQGLKEQFRNDPEALANAAQANQEESELAELLAEKQQLEGFDALDPDAKEDVEADIDADIARVRSRRNRARRRQQDVAKNLEKIEDTIAAEVSRLPDDLTQSDQHARSLGIGGDSHVAAAKRLELGERVMRSDKLKRLARLVGAFKEVAFEVRRKRITRWPQETHSIAMSDDLERLLPSELLGLRGKGRGVRLDFLRRYTERQLGTYELKAPASRGPMVICLDGSGSMQGSKELWGKAVALTLMEIARRERRRCLSIVFSSGSEPFEVELLATGAAGARAQVRDEQVLRFAEHFPGGGTDFEPPLRRAIEAVTQRDYRRGDIVFITDGQAGVSPGLVREIATTKKRHQYRIFGILMNMDGYEAGGLEAFADEVRTVTDLTADSIADLFASV
jgi:uncharacterized protein with von Willebrand factor type A (vWA) domain